MTTFRLIQIFVCSIIILNFYCLAFENDCTSKSTGDRASTYIPRYLFYDVNLPEGFNLRRDVYIRLAVFMKNLVSSSESSHWHLVLPPWPHLYHWRSVKDVGIQNQISWSEFFDVDSMKKFSPVVEMHQVLDEIKSSTLDVTLVLQHFKNAFTDDNWSWDDKWEFTECSGENAQSYRKKDGVYEGFFWGYRNVTSKELFCVSFQGQASKLQELLLSVDRRLVTIDHAEVALHDGFGDADYWRCRRSMRFAPHLISASNEFRKSFLNSSDETDKTVKPPSWEDEKVHRKALGGNYLSVHLRRRDFEMNRKDEVPTLEHAAQQISEKLEKLKLNKVFIATDAPQKFVQDLKKKLSKYDILQYKETLENKIKFKDGGLAIIDQIICSHARYFLGSYESTFSFRIQEEREILGFPAETTFNRFCGSKMPCTQPTKWLITH